MKPYCFVLMPFGTKTDDNGKTINFDAVYHHIIKPAIEDAQLEPIRADEEKFGGIIHKAMFERLMICDYAIADLTTANANVFYELGIRHGVRPHSTALIFSKETRLPFDVSPLRALPYSLDNFGHPDSIDSDRENLARILIDSRTSSDDSPVYQLVHDMPRIEIQRLKTDTFRDTVEYEARIKSQIESARNTGEDALKAIEEQLSVQDTPPAVLIDLLLSYRALKSWQNMVDLVNKLVPPLTHTILVQEQLGFALNRLKLHKHAEKVLKNIIDTHGPSSETNGILGRVYKDLWEEAKSQSSPVASGYLAKAISTYLEGFEMDWRDAYPGINAATLMEMKSEVDPRQKDILPVIKYSVERRLSGKQPDYWDYATLLELAVLSGNQEESEHALGTCLAEIREIWEPETTARNIRLIRERRDERGDNTEWIQSIEATLIQHSKNI